MGTGINTGTNKVLFYTSFNLFPTIGTYGFIYIDSAANIAYLWDATVLTYVQANRGPDIPDDPTPLAFVNVATVNILSFSPVYYNGVANDGVGATLTASVFGKLTDGSASGFIDYNYAAVVGDFILVKNQVAQQNNGLYEIISIGSASTYYSLQRIVDYDNSAALYPLQISVLLGQDNALKYFTQTTVNPVIGNAVTGKLVFLGSSLQAPPAQIAFVDTATSAALPTCVYASGSAVGVPGLNATLTGSVVGALPTINGLTPSISALSGANKILVKNQVDSSKNGDYVVVNAGSATTKWILKRINFTAASFDRYTRMYVVSNVNSTAAGIIYYPSINNTRTNLTIGTPTTGNISFIPASSSGTVTSVAALTLGTTGTDLSSTVATGTTTPVITLNIPTASATNRGALSSADWSTFNSKQNVFTGYDYEIHVSQVDGNDTTGNGDLLKPVASITKALTLITGDRRTIIIHPGTYTENPSITTQYTVLTTFEDIGGNTLISGTVSTSTGCSIIGLKMTNLTITAASGTGNVNILNSDVSGTITKSGSSTYTFIRFTNFGTANITGSGLVDIYGGTTNFLTVNNAAAQVLLKNGTSVAPVLTAGYLNIVQMVIIAAVTNGVTSAAGSILTIGNTEIVNAALTGVSPVVLNGFYSIFNTVFDKPSSTLVAASGTGGSTNSIDYFQYINADKFIKQDGTSSQFLKADGSVDSTAYQAALTLTTTGTSGAATLSGSTLNIPQYTSSIVPSISPNETFRGLAFNNNTTTTVLSGGVTISTTATAVAKNVSGSSFVNKVVGIGYSASVVSTGRYTGIRGGALLWFIGGGFRYTCSFNVSDTVYGSGCRQFYGMQSSIVDLTYTDSVLVASLLNCVGVGSDALDTNLQIFSNDASGVATKVDLGVNFPANRTAGAAMTTIYEVQLYNAPGTSTVVYRVENRETAAFATGTISTDLPLGTLGLNFFASRCMGSPLTNTGQFILTGQCGVYSTN